jgi:Mg-chelatase subunit ChlD
VGGNRERDERTGRPRLGPFEAVASLSDRELEEELLTAAAAPDHRRFERFARLLRERERRAREGELVLVVVTGQPSTRAELAGELARMLGAAYLREEPVRAALADYDEAASAAVLAALVDANLSAGISVLVDCASGMHVQRALEFVYRNHPDTPVVQIDAIGDASRPVANVADEVWGRARGSGDL